MVDDDYSRGYSVIAPFIVCPVCGGYETPSQESGQQGTALPLDSMVYTPGYCSQCGRSFSYWVRTTPGMVSYQSDEKMETPRPLEKRYQGLEV